jgi:hypothetical protein
MKGILILLGILLTATAVFAEDVNIEKVTNLVLPIKATDTFTITGTGFGNDDNSVVMISVNKETVQDIKKTAATVKWEDKKIIVNVPEFLLKYQEGVSISVTVFEGKSKTKSAPAKLYIVRNVVNEAIKLKQGKKSDQGIIDHLFHQQEELLEEDPYAPVNSLFGAIQLTAEEVNALSDAGFDERFISKMAGHHQYFSLGMSGVYLKDTNEWVGAPTARIYLRPKGFYSPRRPIVSYKKSLEENLLSLIKAPFRSVFWERVDLTIGYTSTAKTSSEAPAAGTQQETGNYLLLGGSYEINRFLHLTGGAAIVPGAANKDKLQTFIGINLDPNIVNIDELLKKIGLASR